MITTSRFLSLAAAVLCGLTASANAQTIPKGNIVVDIEPFATLPTSDNGQTARANVLRPAPDSRLFANDQRGEMYTISPDGAAVTLYLDLNKYVPLLFDNGERGFQSFAFHPDFSTPGAAGYGKFYTMGSQSDTSATPTFAPNVSGATRDHDEVLLEWTAADPTAGTFTPIDPAHPFRQVLRIYRPASNHNAGYISFNPTAPVGSADYGNLYFGTGDSGGSGDPLNLAQSPGKAYGAILRINPLATAAAPYTVPADNPFLNTAGYLPEKFMAGFRNPQRFTWDPTTGRMFVSDIGQGRWEELDLAQTGANYGWHDREGDYEYHNDDSVGAFSRGDSATTGFTYPIAEYAHFGSIGNAVTIGPVVRDDSVPGLNGRLVFSDFPTGTPYTIAADGVSSTGSLAAITELRLRQNGLEMSFLSMIQQITPGASRADLRWGVDAQNRIYLLDKQDGLIRRIVSTTPPPVISPAPTPTPEPTPPPVPPAGAKPLVSAGIADFTAISRAAGQHSTIALKRTGDLSADLKVKFTLVGTAINGKDYALRPGKKIIKAGRDTAFLIIEPLPGGDTGKVRLVLTRNAAYEIDPNGRKAKVSINE